MVQEVVRVSRIRVALMVVVVMGMVLGASTAWAAPWQPFSYTSDSGKVRICKGDTSTGDAICRNYASASAEVAGIATPIWDVSDGGTYRWLRYDSPFKDTGAGLYRFFQYANDRGQVRICVGHTAKGQAVCRDGTSYSASSKEATAPKIEPDTGAAVNWFKFFHWSAPGKAGRWDFTTYRNDSGQVRVCRMDTKGGSTVCQDYVAYTATTKGPERPRWQQQDGAKIRYLKY